MAKIHYHVNRPPFGGGGMSERECRACHYRWADRLKKRPHRLPKKHPVRELYEGGHQCGGCACYIALESSLGMDWGVCANPKSSFDGRVVFEHHSCLRILERRSKRGVEDCPICGGVGESPCGICRGTGQIVKAKKRRK